MTTLDPGMIAVEVLTLLLALGGILISLGRNRAKKQEVDMLALQVAVELAEKTPELEERLRDTMAQLVTAQMESRQHQSQLTEMEATIQQQATALHQLKAENVLLSNHRRPSLSTPNPRICLDFPDPSPFP